MFTKPIGGFWGSPVDSQNGWKEYVKRNDLHYGLDELFKFTLTDNAKILHINCAAQLDELPKLTPIIESIYTTLDFEEIQKEYDGIELHLSDEIYPEDADWSYKGLYYRLYCWDCDSILIFNYKVIQVL